MRGEGWKTFYLLVKTLATQLHASHTRPYYESANCIQVILKICYCYVQEPGNCIECIGIALDETNIENTYKYMRRKQAQKDRTFPPSAISATSVSD